MPKTFYSERLLVDCNFLRWLKNDLKKDDENKYRNVVRKLTFIKASSGDHKRRHNIILRDEFDTIVKENLFDDENLRAIVKPIDKPFFIKSTDGISTNIRTAVYLTNDSPYRTTIFTSKDKITQYTSNEHYQNLEATLTVKSDFEAVEVVNYLFKQFERQRETMR